MLSNLDTASQQQITSILTELAQTAGAIVPGGALREATLKGAPTTQTARQKCFSAIATLLKNGPFNVNQDYPLPLDHDDWVIPLTGDLVQDVSLEFRLDRSDPVTSPVTRRSLPPRPRRGAVFTQSGLVAFFPVPARATLSCRVTMAAPGAPVPIFLSAPSVVYLYTRSEWLNPQRDFLTNPQETLTFSGGFITGHKYTGQSPAKTIVDTLTAPIRALMPSVSIQQQTQVQTGGGKPDQTTSSTQTTIGPPKSQ